MPTMKIGIGPACGGAVAARKSGVQRATSASNSSRSLRGCSRRRSAQVLEFLVPREFERGVVLAARLDLREPLRDEVEVVVVGGPRAQARLRQRRAAEGRALAQAGLELGLGLGEPAVELQLQRPEIAEIRRVEAGVARAVHQRQRLLVQADALVHVRQARERGAVARPRDHRVAQARARGVGVADLGQRLRDLAHLVRVVGQRERGELQLRDRVAQLALRQDHAGQQQARRHLPRLRLQQRFQRLARGREAARADVVLGVEPQLLRIERSGTVHGGVGGAARVSARACRPPRPARAPRRARRWRGRRPRRRRPPGPCSRRSVPARR
jgi:hypothetical protein